jgi:hypothetical protein
VRVIAIAIFGCLGLFILILYQGLIYLPNFKRKLNEMEEGTEKRSEGII